MIRIDRGVEPDALRPARRRGLARAVLSRRGGRPPRFDGYNLPQVREALYEAQHGKCAYCERSIGKAGQPVEHFRPKQGADRGDPFTGARRVLADRYWWLAWSWSNLVLSCATCNSATFKGNRFPLAADSIEMDVPDGLITDAHDCFDLSDEQRLLLDPAVDDPLDHITWRPRDLALPYEGWRAYHRTERGRVTIHVLGLDGRNVDHVGQHIRHQVKHRIEQIRHAINHSPQLARKTWRSALENLFAPGQPLQAATHDALDFLIPVAERRHRSLELPRPGAPVRVAAPIAAEPPQFAGVPDDVVLEILADERATGELLVLVCASRASTTEELARLLAQSPTAIGRHCRKLVRQGALVADEQGRLAAIRT